MSKGGQAPKQPPQQPPQQPQILKGGTRAHLLDLAQKFSNPIHFYVLIALVLAITYVKEIPLAVRSQAGTLLGRLFLFSLTLAVGTFYSWTNGLLMAILTLLLLSLSPRNFGTEGFQPFSGTSLKLIENNKKWFSERLLKENPIAIEETEVQTQAIQDSSNSSRSTVAQGTSNK
jgi:hypothetical protein